MERFSAPEQQTAAIVYEVLLLFLSSLQTPFQSLVSTTFCPYYTDGLPDSGWFPWPQATYSTRVSYAQDGFGIFMLSRHVCNRSTQKEYPGDGWLYYILRYTHRTNNTSSLPRTACMHDTLGVRVNQLGRAWSMIG